MATTDWEHLVDVCINELHLNPKLRVVDAAGVHEVVRAEVAFSKTPLYQQLAQLFAGHPATLLGGLARGLLAQSQQQARPPPVVVAQQQPAQQKLAFQSKIADGNQAVSRPQPLLPVKGPLETQAPAAASQQAPSQPTTDVKSPIGQLCETKGPVLVMTPKPAAKPLIPGGPCENPFCGVVEAPQWRRIEKKLVCNRCGMYYHRHARFPDWSYFHGLEKKQALRQYVVMHRTRQQSDSPPPAAQAPMQAQAPPPAQAPTQAQAQAPERQLDSSIPSTAQPQPQTQAHVSPWGTAADCRETDSGGSSAHINNGGDNSSGNNVVKMADGNSGGRDSNRNNSGSGAGNEAAAAGSRLVGPPLDQEVILKVLTKQWDQLDPATIRRVHTLLEQLQNEQQQKLQLQQQDSHWQQAQAGPQAAAARSSPPRSSAAAAADSPHLSDPQVAAAERAPAAARQSDRAAASAAAPASERPSAERVTVTGADRWMGSARPLLLQPQPQQQQPREPCIAAAPERGGAPPGVSEAADRGAQLQGRGVVAYNSKRPRCAEVSAAGFGDAGGVVPVQGRPMAVGDWAAGRSVPPAAPDARGYEEVSCQGRSPRGAPAEVGGTAESRRATSEQVPPPPLKRARAAEHARGEHARAPPPPPQPQQQQVQQQPRAVQPKQPLQLPQQQQQRPQEEVLLPPVLAAILQHNKAVRAAQEQQLHQQQHQQQQQLHLEIQQCLAQQQQWQQHQQHQQRPELPTTAAAAAAVVPGAGAGRPGRSLLETIAQVAQQQELEQRAKAQQPRHHQPPHQQLLQQQQQQQQQNQPEAQRQYKASEQQRLRGRPARPGGDVGGGGGDAMDWSHGAPAQPSTSYDTAAGGGGGGGGGILMRDLQHRALLVQHQHQLQHQPRQAVSQRQASGDDHDNAAAAAAAPAPGQRLRGLAAPEPQGPAGAAARGAPFAVAAAREAPPQQAVYGGGGAAAALAAASAAAAAGLEGGGLSGPGRGSTSCIDNILDMLLTRGPSGKAWPTQQQLQQLQQLQHLQQLQQLQVAEATAAAGGGGFPPGALRQAPGGGAGLVLLPVLDLGKPPAALAF